MVKLACWYRLVMCRRYPMQSSGCSRIPACVSGSRSMHGLRYERLFTIDRTADGVATVYRELGIEAERAEGVVRKRKEQMRNGYGQTRFLCA